MGESAVGLIRLSGPRCPSLASAVMARSTAPASRRAVYGSYHDLQGRALDDCLFILYPKGRSFTGEAMLELSPHGNPLILQKIVEDLLARGCRAAEPGEFTRTAFLKGKMDLSQAEAVADLIRARSDRSLEAARRQLHGAVGRRIGALTERLLAVMAEIEAYIDFPEEDLPAEDEAGPLQAMASLKREMEALAETRHFNALLHEGVKTLIVGAPNAIVSEMPGTTRDYVDDYLMLGPWRIHILDTAGLRRSPDAIEQLGIEHTLEQAETADTFLLVLDGTCPAPTLPDSLLRWMRADNTVVLRNKSDLGEPTAPGGAPATFPAVTTALPKGEGLDRLKSVWLECIEGLAARSRIATDGLTVNARHAAALGAAAQALGAASDRLREGAASELAAAELRAAVDALSEVVGRIDNERILDQLFSKFCIGK